MLEAILLEIHPSAALQLQGFRLLDDGSSVPPPQYVGAEVGTFCTAQARLPPAHLLLVLEKHAGVPMGHSRPWYILGVSCGKPLGAIHSNGIVCCIHISL